jgi:anti-sigma regulatory factor (Ser/Thr protein kinase)
MNVSSSRRFRRSSDQILLARGFVRDALAGRVDRPTLDDAVLVGSELFTNALLHGAGEVVVHVELSPAEVDIEVVDGGGERPVLRPAPVPATSLTGRGLRIVETLASAWGDGRDAMGGTRVWARLERR